MSAAIVTSQPYQIEGGLIFKSLTTRVIAISVSLIATGIGVFGYLNLKRQEAQLINSARESSALLLQTIERSIYKSMLIGDSQDVQATLEILGRSHKLSAVRIFHPQGIVLKSSNPDEVGVPAKPDDYSLFINNRKVGIFEAGGAGEVLGMVKPIYNEVPCHICHGDKRHILGVLNLNYSLAETNAQIRRATNLFFASTLAIIAFLSAAISLVMVKFVKKPLNLVIDKMTKVEQGDLSVRVSAEGKDEVGKLITSFDSMVDRLDTAKKELEQYHFQQMERADRLASVGEMAAGIAHEIRNPLAGIAGAMSVIQQDFTDTDPRKEIIGEVLEQISRLDKTVNDLLFFGKPAEPEPTYTDLNSILQKTLLFALQHRGGKNIKNMVHLQENLPPVYVDPKQVQQVFLNLILNAIQAMPDQGVLTISSSRIERDGGDWVQVCISDTGPGIPPQILGKIFTPFFTTKSQGTGLGLPICHKLITQHHGTISVSSENGVGTRFTIELPASNLVETADNPAGLQ